MKSKRACWRGSEDSGGLSGKSASGKNMLGHVTGLARLQQIPTVSTSRGEGEEERGLKRRKGPPCCFNLTGREEVCGGKRRANNTMIPEASELRPSSFCIQGRERMRDTHTEREAVGKPGGGEDGASERKAVTLPLLPPYRMGLQPPRWRRQEWCSPTSPQQHRVRRILC